MPNTGQFEEYEKYILKAITTLIEETDGQVTLFLAELHHYVEYIIGEARRNNEEYIASGGDSIWFFSTMLDKVKILEEDIFSKTDSNILYKPLNIKADEKGNIEAVYSIYIYNSLQHVKHCISRYLLLPLDEFQYQSSLSRFTLRVNKTVLNDAYNQLIKFGFIPKGTDKKNFVNVFTGGLVKKPIVWLGGYNSLAYLVKGLLKYEAIKSLKNKHWKEVQKHFVTEDGKITDTDSLRNSDPPEDASNLDLIIETFCTPIE